MMKQSISVKGMSGGHLYVLDRAGREVKQFDLPSGLATLGRDPPCDIRIMLRSVQPHHATVVVHANQAVVRNVGSGETLLNGVSISVAALRQDDVLSLGGRELRWRYARPAPHHARRRPDSPALVGARSGQSGQSGRGRRSEGARLQNRHHTHRDSAPASISTRQVAIVQPQRRDTTNHIESVSSSAISVVTNVRRRGTIKSDSDMDMSLNKSIEDHNKSKSPKNPPINLQNTTKATLWIESRKTSPRKSLQEIPTRAAITPKKSFSAKKSTPLRMAVLKKAQSAQKTRVSKIQAPLTVDHTKQAAIMLMAGHTPKQKGHSPTVSQQGGSARRSTLLVGIKTPRPRGRPPKKSLSASPRSAGTNSTLDKNSNQSASVIEITDSYTQQATMRESEVSRSSSSPRKSALRDPNGKRSSRKAESIKFDLSNLEDEASSSALRYSESPSSPRPAQSRARDILRRTLGDSAASPTQEATTTPTPPLHSPRLNRGSLMLRRALHTTSPVESYSIVDLVSGDSSSYGSASDASRYESPNPDRSSRVMRTRSLLASSTPAVHRVRSRSAITSQSYETIHDDSQSTIFSESNRRSKSLCNPVDLSKNGTYNVSGKKGKSQSPINLEKVQGNVTFNIARKSRQSLRTPDNSKENVTFNITSLTTENTTATFNASGKSRRTRSTLEIGNSPDNITLNSTRPVSLFSQNRSRLTEVDMVSARDSLSKSASPKNDGASTPKNQRSPEEAGTPMLSIQSLLDSTQNSTLPQQSMKKAVTRMVTKRKTIGSRLSISTNRGNVKSKSLSWSTRPSLRSRKSKSSPADSDISLDVSLDDGDTTPKSAVKLVQEAVKNKHSTAKKPKSKRSIIDNLNDSDIVKQLFNSPVKRKLSQSMIEFSRRHSEEDFVPAKRSTRNTIALTGKTPENSILVQSLAFAPEFFVSPLSTPSNSPNVLGIKRLFAKTTPENDLRNVRGVKKLMQTTRLRRSIRNDLTQVSGVKLVFGRSPRNRLSDVRIKEIFANSPKNDLRRVSGVKTLFQPQKKNKSPKNDLRDVANVRNLYKKNSPRNDLSNVSGVKRGMRKNSPKNDLTDVRGLRTLFHLEKNRDDLNNISGIEELFSESQSSNVTHANSESSFNLLVGKPAVRAYPKAKSFITNSIQKPKFRKAKSLQTSFSLISNNVEDWLENELRKRMHKDDDKIPSSRKSLRKNNQENMSISTSKANRSSSIISKGNMSRSRNVSVISKSGISGRKSMKNNSDTILQGSKSKFDASNTSINEAVISASRNSFSKSKDKTAINNSDIIDAGDEILKGNRTNKLMSNEGTHTKTLKSRNKTTSNKSDVIVGNDETSKGINSKVNSSNTSVNRSKTSSEETPRKTSKSKNKTNRSRELLKLATDTVEGNTPVLTTRVRNSTLIKTSSVESAERKKSTSEIYGAHTLPIKKRSLVDTSGNRSREKSVLPIKKRAVVHSTPVKGRVNMTLNASEIGRVSPIALLLEEVTYESVANPTTRSTEEPKNSPKRKQIQTSDSKTLTAEGNKDRVTPPPVRATRRRKTRQSLDVNNVIKRKSSIVISKKTPGLSPKLSTIVSTEVPHAAENTQPLVRKTRGRNLTRENDLIQVDSGKEKPVTKNVRKNIQEIQNQKSDSENQKKKPGRKTNIGKPQEDPNKKTSTSELPPEETALNPRKTRGQKIAVVKTQTPKKLTRSKASKTGVVITKPSPQIKLDTKNHENETENSSKTKMPRTRNAKAHNSKTNEFNAKEKAPIRKTRNTKKGQITTDRNAKKSNKEVEPNVKSQRGRKTIAQRNTEVESKETEVKTRSTRNAGQQQTARETSGTNLRKLASQEAGKKVADLKNMNSGPSENISRRRKRTCTVEKSPSQTKKPKMEDDITRRNRGNEIETESSQSKQQNLTGRTKTSLNNLQSSQDKEPVKESKGRRGGKDAEVTSLETGKSRRAAKTRGSNKTSDDIQPVRTVRGRKTQTVDANKRKSPEANTEKKKTTRRPNGDGAKRKPEQAKEKTTGRQKISEIPKTEVMTTRRQKATEPEKPLAGRKRKNNADGSTVKEASKPSKARKTNAVSPKSKRGRGSKTEESQKPAARSRRR